MPTLSKEKHTADSADHNHQSNIMLFYVFSRIQNYVSSIITTKQHGDKHAHDAT